MQCLVLTIVLLTASAKAQPPTATVTPELPDKGIEGIWLGFEPLSGHHVVFKISRTSEGTLVATMDSLERGRKDVPVSQITFRANRLHVEIQKIDAVYDGVLSADGTEMKGPWRQEDTTRPIRFRKTNKAPDVPKPGFGIFVAAIIATLLSLLLLGGAVRALTPKTQRWFALVLLALHLPMCALAFYCVRLPLDSFLKTVMHPRSEFYALTIMFYAPLTEELAKLWLLIFPPFRAKLDQQSALWLGLAIGLGFGIGEAWLVAYWLWAAHAVSVPWYMLGGYINERFLVCLNHGAFTAVALRRMRQAPVRSILLAMLLHFAGNFPIYLAKWLAPSERQVILSLWVLLFSLAMFWLLVHLFEVPLRRALLGRAKCPECGLVYERPWLAVNMGKRRYEPCPGCKKWHWTQTEKQDSSQVNRSIQ